MNTTSNDIQFSEACGRWYTVNAGGTWRFVKAADVGQAFTLAVIQILMIQAFQIPKRPKVLEAKIADTAGKPARGYKPTKTEARHADRVRRLGLRRAS